MCLVDNILDPRRQSCVICHVNQTQLVVVNRVRLSQITLLKFLSFPHSHAFWDA
jgi:hypothetical protein